MNRSMRIPWPFAVAAFLVLVALVVGCNDDPLAPFQPEVFNNVDTFELQATNLTNVSATRTYSWENTGTTANINQATVLSDGSAVLTVRDAVGTQVYSRDLTENGTSTTAEGISGTWTLQLQLTNCSGTLNFRAEKP